MQCINIKSINTKAIQNFKKVKKHFLKTSKNLFCSEELFSNPYIES